jgi:hypothetical protein
MFGWRAIIKMYSGGRFVEILLAVLVHEDALVFLGDMSGLKFVSGGRGV